MDETPHPIRRHHLVPGRHNREQGRVLPGIQVEVGRLRMILPVGIRQEGQDGSNPGIPLGSRQSGEAAHGDPGDHEPGGSGLQQVVHQGPRFLRALFYQI